MRVCVIGHVTKDKVKIGREEWIAPGGTAYYLSIALHSLGIKPFVVTKLRREDRYLIRDLESRGINLHVEYTSSTTTFENIYTDGQRKQRVKSVAPPFRARDVESVDADLFYIGSLTKNDVERDLFKKISRYTLALDAQGMLREVNNGEVVLKAIDDFKILSYVDIIKLNWVESFTLTRKKSPKGAAEEIASYGPKEVIITMGKKGSIIYANNEIYTIPSFNTDVIDPTGCGDTYMAGYIYKRMQTSNYKEIGLFSSALASIKLSRKGPFTGSEKDVESFINSSGKGREVR